MTISSKLARAREKGFVFDGARDFMTDKVRGRLAMDASLVTVSNSGIPSALTAYIDPQVIRILTAKRSARDIFPEVKKGDWSNSHAQFKAIEHTGSVSGYTDFGKGKNSDVNANYPTREQYVFETTTQYGMREAAVTARALIDMASEKQISAATTLDIAANKFYLLGVAGKEIYGLINEPNILSTVAPSVVNSSTLFKDKKTTEIYDDFLSLFAALVKNGNGNIDENSEITFAVAPDTSVRIGKATDFNVTVRSMLRDFLPNSTVTMVPELASQTSGNMIMAIAKTIEGISISELGYGEKMRSLPLVQQTSYYEQKHIASTYGCVLYRPFAISTMVGV